jgi:hypothetical protein
MTIKRYRGQPIRISFQGGGLDGKPCIELYFPGMENEPYFRFTLQDAESMAEMIIACIREGEEKMSRMPRGAKP